ncbi:hypothetical protein K458DRAFT_238756, partial [Lentithecium fluviatile CBS 122367]
IPAKDAKSLDPTRTAFFDLPGEIRNRVYGDALGKKYGERVPVNEKSLGRPDTHVALLRVCSQAYHEARAFMAGTERAYIPFTLPMNWTHNR